MVILRKPVAGLNDRTLTRFLARAKREVKLQGTVNLLVTNSRELQSLNRRFRQKNKATDVLSFPALPGLTAGLAGDIAISADIAGKNAKQLGHPTAEEIRILTLHGLLHLAGYDHESDDGKMRRLEDRLRNRLRLPQGLIQRSQENNERNRKRSGRPKLR